jgi:hypothetical protein
MNKHREEWNDHISRITEDRIVWVIKDNSTKGEAAQKDPVSIGMTLSSPITGKKEKNKELKCILMTPVQNGKTVILQVEISEVIRRLFRKYLVYFRQLM